MLRRGSTLTSIVLAVAGVGLAGTVGYMGVTGNTPCSLLSSCDGGSCSGTQTTLVANKTSACPESACSESSAHTEQVAAKEGEQKSCCALKALAESDKRACPSGAEAQIVQVAATQAKADAAPQRPRTYIDRYGRRIGYKKARIMSIEERMALAGNMQRINGDAGDAPRTTDASVMAVASTEQGACEKGDACCKGKGAAQVVNAAAAEKVGACESACKGGAAQVINAAAKEACEKGDACCKNKGAAQVVNAAAAEVGACESACKGGAVQVINAAAKEACEKGDACCKNKGAAQVVNAAAVEKKGECNDAADCCEGKDLDCCKEKLAAVTAAAAKTAACTQAASACSSSASVCTKSMAAGKQVQVNFVGATMPVVVPAAFYQAGAKIDHASLTDAGCCRSSLKNASGASICGDEAKDCCDKGNEAALIPAAAIDNAAEACEKGADCCKNKAAEVQIVKAAAAEACEKDAACCQGKDGDCSKDKTQGVCDKGEACCKNNKPASE
ncbi:MAG: hypothetical protein KDA20_02315 [Phycisphaerales bacterium]|nr:hypothetical protein [Phycisphaerales bacterium]